MIVIDSIDYDIPIVSLSGQADMLDKYAERTVDGVLHRELIGVYDNYEIQFAPSYRDSATYSDLWFKLTEPVPWHTVKFPTIFGEREIEGYFANTRHEVSKQKGGVTYWKGLSTSFVSKSKRPTT
jgi:hypothetical protein